MRSRKKYLQEYLKVYRKEHSKEIQVAKAAWYQKNKNGSVLRNRNKNRNRIRRWNVAWIKKHPEVDVANQAKRRTRKTRAGGSYVAQQFLSLCKECHYRCLCCGKRRKLTADHVVPVAKGGTSNIDNIQPLCRFCNSSKGTKTTDYRTNKI